MAGAMLLISDNPAAHIGLRLAGGPEAVNGRPGELGVAGIEVDRPTALLIADVVGVEKLPPEAEWTPQMFRKLMSAVAGGKAEAGDAAVRRESERHRYARRMGEAAR